MLIVACLVSLCFVADVTLIDKIRGLHQLVYHTPGFAAQVHDNSTPIQSTPFLSTATMTAQVHDNSTPIQSTPFVSTTTMTAQSTANDMPCAVTCFIGITSKPSHNEKRHALRQSWLAAPNLQTVAASIRATTNVAINFHTRFFIAQDTDNAINRQVVDEDLIHSDMQILNFTDTYTGLVLKTVALVTYATTHTSASLILKADDDTFIRLDELLLFVLSHYSLTTDIRCGQNIPPFYLARFHSLVPITRRLGRLNDTEDAAIDALVGTPYYVQGDVIPISESINGYFPPYGSGAGYMISRPLADIITQMHAAHQLRLLRAEDVSVGLWVHAINQSGHFKNGVEYITQLEGRMQFAKTECRLTDIMLHYVLPAEMVCMGRKIDTMLAFNQSGEWCCRT